METRFVSFHYEIMACAMCDIELQLLLSIYTCKEKKGHVLFGIDCINVMKHRIQDQMYEVTVNQPLFSNQYQNTV